MVLLLFNGDPLDISWAKDNPAVTAIMECFYPGQEGGNAIYKTLTMKGGTDAVPAARLPNTWPKSLAQVDLHHYQT